MKGRSVLMIFSELVKKVRVDLNISQEDLARALDISFATVNRWENGKTEPNRLTKKVFYDFCVQNNINEDALVMMMVSKYKGIGE